MAQYKVTSPEGKQYVLNGPEGASRDQVLEVLKYKLGQEERPDRSLGQEISAGFARGKERLKSTLGDVLPAMIASGLGFEDYAKRQMEEAAQTQRDIAEFNPPSYQSYKEITGPRSALGYAAETLGETAPDILASLIPGGIGGAAARRLGVSGLEALGEAGAQQIARRGAMGEAAGIYLGSYAQNAPEVFQSIYNETGQLEPGVAALFGSVSAGLDSVLPASLIRSMSAPVRVGVVEKILERSGMEPSLLRKVVAQVPGSAVKEGLTEAAQEAINITAEDFVKKTDRIWDSSDWNRIVESGVRGAIAGGAFGVPGAVSERVREKAEEPARMGEQIAAEEERLANLIPEQVETLPLQMNKLERQDLLDAGLKPQSVYLREMVGKDLTVPEELAQVETTLDKMRQNPKMNPEVLASVENVVEAYRSQPAIEPEIEETPTSALFSADRRKTKERIPELEEMARGVQEGKLTKEQYDEGVKALKPVTPYTEIPAPATAEDLERSLSTDKQERIYSPREELEEGYPVGLRLDIPAYTNHGVWAISVHEQQKNYNAGKSIGYDSVAAVTNPTFGAVEKAALSIAGGKAKSTIAVVKGNWLPISEEQAVKKANEALTDKNWAQVGMDPTRHSYFYDRTTGEPIVSGDEAIMVGPLVLVKNPVYAPKSQFLFSRSPLVNAPTNQKGMTKEQVDRAVNNIKRTWTNAPKHITVQSVADLPKHLRDQAAEDKVNPRGVYEPDTKLVYLVADNIANDAQAAITLAHEALGHFGLRVLLGKNFKPMLRSVYDGNKAVRERADEYISQGVKKEDAIEEVLSEMAQEVYDTRVEENKNKLSALQKFINYIRQFFRRMGIVKDFTDKDILGLIRDARHAVVTGPVKEPISEIGRAHV